uniref:limulus clotting factor C n=1 Tax=Strigamia maritima TaxID=126957 RepID=T1J7V4_STRMM
MIVSQIKLTLLCLLIIVLCTESTLSRFKRQDLFFPDLRGRGTFGQPCNTYREGAGKCLPLKQCQSLRSFRQSTSCSYYNSVPLVCCPIKKSSQSDASSTNRPVTQSTTRVFRQTASDCGLSETGVGFRIINGQAAGLHAWPWMAAIYDLQFGVVSFRCGGILVNDKYILTAAHCVSDTLGLIPANKFNIRLGELNLNSDSDGARPITFGYNMAIRQPILHDIALMELSQSITRSKAISPICLPTKKHESESFEKTKPTVIGWGKTENRFKIKVLFRTYSDVLRQVPLPVTELEKCKAVYYNVPIGATHLCAGYPQGGKDSCQGDSGGPLMSSDLRDGAHRWMVIGIVSMGLKCAEPGYPGVYTRVTSYIDWINENGIK